LRSVGAETSLKLVANSLFPESSATYM
jgi:hypothetical protein